MIPPLRPVVLLFIGRVGSAGTGHSVNTHRAAGMLIIFPKHILEPYPLCRKRTIFIHFFCFHIVLLLLFFFNIYDASWEEKRRRMCVVWGAGNVYWHLFERQPYSQVEKHCMKSKYCESPVLMQVFFLVTPFSALEFPALLAVFSVQEVLSDWRGALIVFYLWWHLSSTTIRNAVWNEIKFVHSLNYSYEATVSRSKENKRPLGLCSTVLPLHGFKPSPSYRYIPSL